MLKADTRIISIEVSVAPAPEPFWTLCCESEQLYIPIRFAQAGHAMMAARIIMAHCPELRIGCVPHNHPWEQYIPAWINRIEIRTSYRVPNAND